MRLMGVQLSQTKGFTTGRRRSHVAAAAIYLELAREYSALKNT